MPEELVLGLVVLGVVGFIVYGIARVIVEAGRSTNKEVRGLLGKLHSQRIQKKKTALESQVRIFLPESLDKAAQTLKKLEADLSLRRRAPMRTARPPSWNKIDFQPHKLAVQSSAARRMNIADVALILRKDLEAGMNRKSVFSPAIVLTPPTLPRRHPSLTSDQSSYQKYD